MRPAVYSQSTKRREECLVPCQHTEKNLHFYEKHKYTERC